MRSWNRYLYARKEYTHAHTRLDVADTVKLGRVFQIRVKAGGLNRLRSRLCGRAVSNGRSEWAQACWQNNAQGIRAIAGSCYLHGHCLVGHAMAEIEQSAAGLVAVDAF